MIRATAMIISRAAHGYEQTRVSAYTDWTARQ
jgi:hypothetical protein